MGSAISYEYFNSLINEPHGIAGIGEDGKLPIGIMPGGSVETYKGIFATSVLLIAAHPIGSVADYAFVTATESYWYWNAAIVTPGWVNQCITAAAYLPLTTAAKAEVPYIIIPV